MERQKWRKTVDARLGWDDTWGTTDGTTSACAWKHRGEVWRVCILSQVRGIIEESEHPSFPAVMRRVAVVFECEQNNAPRGQGE
jgi:hypothetical protein